MATRRGYGALAMAACLLLAGGAHAATEGQPLRLRLVIVESCQDGPLPSAAPEAAARCAAPHQRGESTRLPEQLRQLAPDTDATEGSSAPLMVF